VERSVLVAVLNAAVVYVIGYISSSVIFPLIPTFGICAFIGTQFDMNGYKHSTSKFTLSCL
jgi:uncharacterized membrane protein (GlpM family)